MKGKDWEAAITASCRYYRQEGLARVSRHFEPYVQIGHPDKRGCFKARRTGDAPPDYSGLIYGKPGYSTLFDAKECKGGRWGFGLLKKHQAMDLTAELQGGVPFLLIRFNGYDGPSGFVSWEQLRPDWWAWFRSGGKNRASLSPADVRPIPMVEVKVGRKTLTIPDWLPAAREEGERLYGPR